jgi:hypothetical protein
MTTRVTPVVTIPNTPDAILDYLAPRTADTVEEQLSRSEAQNLPDVIHIDVEAIDAILQFRFDDEDFILGVPSWETIPKLAANSESQQKNKPWHPIPKDDFEIHAEAMAQ